MSTQRILRKSYAMQRMGAAIERAVDARRGKEKERAARWAAAWGLLCGIRTSTVRLRRSDVQRSAADDIPTAFSGRIEIPGAFTLRDGESGEAAASLLPADDGPSSAADPRTPA